jgi:hypothetical protein
MCGAPEAPIGAEGREVFSVAGSHLIHSFSGFLPCLDEGLALACAQPSFSLVVRFFTHKKRQNMQHVVERKAIYSYS